MKDILVTKATEICGKMSGKPKEEKDTWWWNDEVQAAIKNKKLALKQIKDIENDTTKENYRQAKKQAKRAVARAKSNTYRDWYERLDTPDGEKIIYRVVKVRNEMRKDFGEVAIVKDQNGDILMMEEDIKRRWQEYFSNQLNMENEYEELSETLPVEGPIPNISRREVDKAIKKGKTNKAGGKSEVTIEIIKAVGEFGVEWTYLLLEKIWSTEKMPEDWKECRMVKLYKQKRDILSCENYRVLDTIMMNVRDNEDLWELLFTDDLVIIADTEEELQERYLLWKGNLERKGMKVSTQKTEVMVSSREGYEEINVTSEDVIRLNQTREFKYLGSVIAEEGGTEKCKTRSLRKKEEGILERMEMRMCIPTQKPTVSPEFIIHPKTV
ncbi:uncharacterized protein LOC135103270 [Scylla paramamosain]|uniref:uncharacterized protein LOC135103270 n=1 Tax=Scylla paramamosain TaxID=85552 RepID=UPI003082CFB3